MSEPQRARMYIDASPSEVEACLEDVLTPEQLQSLRIRESVKDSTDGGTRVSGGDVLSAILTWYAGGIIYDVTKAGVMHALGDETVEKIRNAIISRFGRDAIVHEEEADGEQGR